MPAGGNSGFGGLASSPGSAAIKVLNGAAAGREVMLTKVVTTVGKPGVQVASITKRPGGYVLAHVEGTIKPTINGSHLAGDSAQLRNGDVIELAGTQMQFIQL
jgi:FtsP/CotA-like multicopper oxidase with cupredoxin domain